MKTYEILEILHSGRKGIRNTPVNNEKYGGIIGSVISLDIDLIEQFKCCNWYFMNHPFYDTWCTSEVLDLEQDERGAWYLETTNTIYVFKEVDYGC